MKIYASSDTHYFHDNIIKYCNRPFRDIEHMNREMLQRWNDVVKPGDIALHIGDVSAALKGRDDELTSLIRQMHGRKVLIRGNHDHLPDSWYLEAGFKGVVNHLHLGDVLFSHHPSQDAAKLHRGIDWSKVGHVVHGHVHRADTPEFQDHFNVAVDRNGFFPVSSADFLFRDRTGTEGLLEAFVDSL